MSRGGVLNTSCMVGLPFAPLLPPHLRLRCLPLNFYHRYHFHHHVSAVMHILQASARSIKKDPGKSSLPEYTGQPGKEGRQRNYKQAELLGFCHNDPNMRKWHPEPGENRGRKANARNSQRQVQNLTGRTGSLIQCGES